MELQINGRHHPVADEWQGESLLHVLREWINGHARGFRWFSWVSGVPLVWLVYASGLGGYWLVYDRLALWSLVATTEWLDALPLFGGTLARNFIVDGVTNRLFSLLIFPHIGIPLALGNLKLVPVALWPFGREIVPMSELSAALGGYRSGQTPPIPPPVELPAEPERQAELEPRRT